MGKSKNPFKKAWPESILRQPPAVRDLREALEELKLITPEEGAAYWPRVEDAPVDVQQFTTEEGNNDGKKED